MVVTYRTIREGIAVRKKPVGCAAESEAGDGNEEDKAAVKVRKKPAAVPVAKRLVSEGAKIKKKKGLGASAEIVEATLLQLVHEGTSDAARVAAAKALMDLVKYMNGENDRAQRFDDRERMEAIREARKLLAEFAALKLGGAVAVGCSGNERTDALADRGEARTDNACG